MTDSTTHPVKKDAKGSSLPAQRGGGKGRPPIAPKPARQLAVEALHRVNAGGGYSNLVLDSALSAQRDLSAREKGFACLLYTSKSFSPQSSRRPTISCPPPPTPESRR